MYQEHFGLNRPPFKITPDTSLFYEGNQRGAALDALMYAINSGEGIIKVVGEVGSGKTMLCRMLEVRLTNDVDVIYIANPSLSPDNILHVIAHELQLDVSDDMSKVSVMQKIQAHLLKKHASNRQVVLFVEEAQSMPIETLEEIRLLSNLETDQNKLLQMVLFGQPELDVKLSQPQIRQLKERITHSFYLTPFPPDDTLQYLNFRLRAVGYKGPDIFSRQTANAVKKYSDGLTRRMNILADKAMLAAFSEGSHSVTPKHIKSAAKDSEFKSTSDNKKIVYPAAVLLLVILASAIGFYAGQQNQPMDQSQPGQELTPAQDNAEVVRRENVKQEAMTPESTTQEHRPEPVTMAPARVSGKVSARLDERITQTQQWLDNTLENHYSIQLFMARTSDADKVEAFLEDTPETLDFTEIYIYETVVNGRAWYSVLYSDFITQNDAIEKLDALPASLKASDPYLRRLGALKKDSARFR